MEEPNNALQNYGTLIISARTAGNALPVESASVTVTGAEESNRDFVRTLTTDISGLTPPISLPAPAKADSLAPGNGRPYAIYNIRIVRDGYYVHENKNAPVFAGVTSIQPAELIPLAPYNPSTTHPRGNTIFISEQTLDGEGN